MTAAAWRKTPFLTAGFCPDAPDELDGTA